MGKIIVRVVQAVMMLEESVFLLKPPGTAGVLGPSSSMSQNAHPPGK